MTALTRILAVCGAFALTLALVTTARAQSSINDCEKIQAADAYNQCLAKFGPPAKSGNLEPERPGDIKSGSADAAASGGKPSRPARHAAGRRHGRVVSARRGRGHGSGHGHGGAHGGRKRMTISVGKK